MKSLDIEKQAHVCAQRVEPPALSFYGACGRNCTLVEKRGSEAEEVFYKWTITGAACLPIRDVVALD